MYDRICPECGKILSESRNPRAKFCKRQCQKNFNAKKSYHLHKSESKQIPRRGDPEVVSGKHLGELISEWKIGYEKKYGITERTNYHRDAVTGAFAWLAFESGVNERRLSGIVNGESKYVSSIQADDILTAIGLNGLLANGTLKTVKSPRWSTEDWQAYMQERGCW